MYVSDTIKQIHDDADHIIGSVPFSKANAIADARVIKRLAKKALNELAGTKGKIYLVIQEGGSSRELYVHAHNNIKEARADIKSCAKDSYRAVGPIEVHPVLAKALRADADVEQCFYNCLANVLRTVATEL
jgi:hypothetical protein